MKKERIKKVNRKVGGGGLIFLLTTLALFSVGFSSWTIAENPRFQQELKVQADQIVDLNDFFNFQEPQMFEISPSGLIIDDEIVYQGDIKISFNVEIKNAIYPYLKENQLDIHFTLEDNSEFNLLQSIFMGSAEPEIYYHVSENYISNPELIYSTQGKLQEKKIQANIVYQNDNLQNINRLFFVLAFHFDFSDYIDSFETSIYNQISNEGLLLDFQIGVENL